MTQRAEAAETENSELTRKLNWWEQPHDAKEFAEIKKQASYQDSLCAQTIYIGHLERHVKELTKLLAEATSKAVTEGCVVVPINPTPEMLHASRAQYYHTPDAHWKAMLAAATQPGGSNE